MSESLNEIGPYPSDEDENSFAMSGTTSANMVQEHSDTTQTFDNVTSNEGRQASLESMLERGKMHHGMY